MTALDDAGAPDASDAAVGDIAVNKLAVQWVTSQSASFRWEPDGAASNLDHYEVVIGPSATAVLGRASEARVFGPTSYLELAGLLGIGTAVPSVTLRAGVVIHELDKGKLYFALVEAHDKKGRVQKSNVVSFTTTTPTAPPVVVFSETAVPDTADFVLGTDRPYAGKSAYGMTLNCPSDTCVGAPALQKLAVSLKAMPKEAFTSAFLEFAVAGEAANGSAPQPAGFTTDVSVSFNGLVGLCPTVTVCRWRFPAWTFLPKGAYRLLQMPLSELINADDRTTKLVYGDLAKQDFNLQAFIISGVWKAGATVRVDEVRVVW